MCDCRGKRLVFEEHKRADGMGKNLSMLLIKALVAVFLGTRLIWLISKSWPDSIGKAVLINVVSAAITVIAAAYVLADGGPPRFNLALSVCGRAQLIVLLFDVVRLIQINSSVERR